ncbi:MAG: ATP synthase F0 subunit B [Verrucomicrobia bacterium]|jgi:F-type H+-transporting ATPase subunit b|nr:MAG: ATP synthase F0 subunit B [Verrucomicrobiota bacterium]MDH4470237.1 ATP synthase F0 subunit B [Verrucomicrobiae bacterium]
MKVLTDLFENFGIDWPKFLAQTILFLVVYLILRRFAFASVITMLEERRRRIEEAQLNAEKIKKQLAEAELRYEEILRKANLDAKKMIDEARVSAEALMTKETQRAIKDAESIIARAHEVTMLDRQHMIDDVKKEMLHLVVQTTSQVVGKIISPEDQQRLSMETTSALATS